MFAAGVHGQNADRGPERITLKSLFEEMIDREVARFPEPLYRSLQASSYNRESVHRDKPGWFADSDGLGFIRTETIAGKTEWVIMEHEGPGCLTRMWTPFFYYDFNDRERRQHPHLPGRGRRAGDRRKPDRAGDRQGVRQAALRRLHRPGRGTATCRFPSPRAAR